jgi:hypothetical protein
MCEALALSVTLIEEGDSIADARIHTGDVVRQISQRALPVGPILHFGSYGFCMAAKGDWILPFPWS